MYKPKLFNIKFGHRARLKANDHRTSSTGLLIEKQYRVLGMRACLFA